MEVRDWITILSVLLVMAGWFVNGYINRRHEIAKRRMDLRLDALESFLPVLFAIQENRQDNPSFSENLARSWTKFQLYCYANEAKVFEKLVCAIEVHDHDHEHFTKHLRALTEIVKNGIREELGLDEFTHSKVDKA